MAATDGPPDPDLWLTRKAGYWESQLFHTMDHASNYSIVLNTWIKSEHIDPVTMERAYRALIYNQPNFRANVRKDEDGSIYFVQATDFSGVFEFLDQSEDTENTGYAGCWSLAESIADIPFSLGSEVPLCKCYLVKRPDGYSMLNKMHHAIADGRTSLRVVSEVLRQYDLLLSGHEADLAPAKVFLSAQELSAFAMNEEVIKRMVQAKIERARNQRVLFPVNMAEVATSRSQVPFTNRTLHDVGTKEGFTKLRALCKKHGLTIGAYSFAVLAMAEITVYERRHGNGHKEDDIHTVYFDVVANLRTRLDPQPGECHMNCIGMIDIKATVSRVTSLLDVANSIYEQLQICYKENRIPLFYACKEEIETGEHAEFFNSLPEGARSEFLPSNQMEFNYPTKFSWGEIESTHTIGSHWCPLIANQILLYQCVNNTMCYSVVCSDGADNIRVAREVFDLFIHVMEHSDVFTESTVLMDLVDIKKS